MQPREPFAGIGTVRRDEPLSRHSQFGVGGPADWFVRVTTLGQLQRVCDAARVADIPVTMLGAGSNALILDGGVRGLVVRYDERSLRTAGDAALLGGGCMMPRAALDCARQGLTGIEFGIGVPGTCGASVYGNAGAFGTEMADVLEACTLLTPSGGLATLANAECGFAYRHSRLKTELSGHIVVQATLRVHRDDPAAVRQRTASVQARRKASQPYGVRSLGSVFKNPPGDAAGRLIEAAGLRGARHGGAQIAEKHANFILNAGGATAADVLALADRAHDTVLQRFGIDLEREIVLLGDPAARRATLSA